MVYEPGTKIQYCNSGYYLLGMIIEQVSSVSYAEYVLENIFGKIGMTNSRLDKSRAIIPNRVSGYELNITVAN